MALASGTRERAPGRARPSWTDQLVIEGSTMQTNFTTQVTLAKVKPGDYVYTTPKPSSTSPLIVQLERPDLEPGIARLVKANEAIKGVGRRLLFSDDLTIAPRNGTALAYVFKLDADGKPLPVPTYPVCPTCGAGTIMPSCHTKSGTWTSMHKSREKLVAKVREDAKANANRPKPVLPKCPVCHQAGAECWEQKDGGGYGIRAEWHPERTAVKDEANGTGKQADLVDASYAAPGKRVHKDPDGTVWIEGWTGGDGEHITPEGWRLHVAADGRVTVLGSRISKTVQPVPVALHATDAEADAKLAAADPPVGRVSDRCDSCKGFGLVRKRGPRKGEKYKTFNGALQAQAGGNAVTCPTCSGAGLVAA